MPSDSMTAGEAGAIVRQQTPAPAAHPALAKCDPALIEMCEGYWRGRAKIRTEEALKVASHAAVPSEGDVLQHRIAQHYEARADELAKVAA